MKVVSFITLVSVEVGPGNKLEDLVCSDKVCATLNLISWAPNCPTGLGNLELNELTNIKTCKSKKMTL